MTPTRVLVTGSRTWPDPGAVVSALHRLLIDHGRLTVVHGACPAGVDAITATWARAHPGQVTEEAHPADWQRHGRAAGPIRNTAMVNAGADVCLAFIHDHSAGASGCADAAEAAGIPTHRHTTGTPQHTTEPPGTLLPGRHHNGWTGQQVYPGGHIGPRSCPRCGHGVDDVTGRGTHPACDPQPDPHPATSRPDPAGGLLTAALATAERGWRVFPLRPGGKRPAVRDWENRATIDPDRITRCWQSGPYNIGIACGPSRLVVVDLDQAKPEDTPPETWAMPGVACGEDVLAVLAERAGQPLPYDTHLVRTGRGGLHAYYTPPDGPQLRNTAGRLGWLVDTRAAGGYVVAAGSIMDGRRYELLYEAPTAPLPSWLADLLTPPTPVAPSEPVTLPDALRLSAYLTSALRAEAARVRDAATGQRNHALYIAAQALGQLVAAGSLTADHVRHVLTAAAAGHVATGAYTERERDATIASGLRAGANRPRRVAA